MNDSLAAFTEAAEIGYVDLVPVPRHGDPGAELVDRLKRPGLRAARGLGRPPRDRAVTVRGPGAALGPARRGGSLEIAVHGWDVAQACGADRPLPAALALDLLDLLPLLVDDADRPARFADPVDVPLHARPSTRLLAALGRPG